MCSVSLKNQSHLKSTPATQIVMTAIEMLLIFHITPGTKFHAKWLKTFPLSKEQGMKGLKAS
jgi:hypothetical protein